MRFYSGRYRFHALLILAMSCGGGSQLEPRFVAVHNTMSAMGMAQSGPISEGSLGEGNEARFDVHLDGGQCYTVVALGTGGVRDIDLRVVGAGDDELGRDVTHDRQAAAQVCPGRSGDFQIVLQMADGSGGYLVSYWSGGSTGGGISRVARRQPIPTGPGGEGTCASPLELALGQSVHGDTTGAQHMMSGPCASGNAPERVYRFEMDQRAQVTVSLTSSYDGAIYILRECGQLNTLVDCNDDNPDTSHSRIDTMLEPGTYYLVVDGYGDASGGYDVAVSVSPMQALGQICGGATALTSGQQVSGTTVGGADYFQATCAGGARAPDQVYSIQVPARSRFRARLDTNTHDGALYLRSTCDDTTSEIACNDDFGDTRRSRISSILDPGEYFLYADGYTGANAGTFDIRADLASPQGGTAAGDTCATPARLNPGAAFEIDTFEAADDMSGSCGGGGAADVVYSLDVRARSQFRATVRDAEFAGAMYIQRTCGDASTEVACQPIQITSNSATESTMEATLTPGQYSLVFDGSRPDAFGAANVQVELTDLQAVERVCRRAPVLRPGRTVNGDTSGESDDFRASCAGGAQSNDKVYRIRLTRRMQVRVTMTSDFDGALHLRRDCADATTEVACNDDHENNRTSRIETTLDRGTYYVVVDGFRTGSQGTYSLELETSRP